MTDAELAQIRERHEEGLAGASPADIDRLLAEVERLRGVAEAALKVRRAADAVGFKGQWRRHYIEGLPGHIEHPLMVECGICKVLDLAVLAELEAKL